MADNKKKITFHVVRSVKGGSGKTAFALHYAAQKATIGEVAKVLYIDADVHASETRNNLFEHAFADRLAINPSDEDGIFFFSFIDSDEYAEHVQKDRDDSRTAEVKKHTLNTYIHPYRGYYSKIGDIIINSRIVLLASEQPQQEGNAKRRVDMIFADPEEHGRRVFGSLFQSAGQSAVGVGAYVAKIKSLLSYILECRKQYNDVVLDMPPGSDTFSEHLMDCLINFIADNKEECELCVYYVATRDRAHIRTAAEAAIDHLHLMRAISPIEICFVDNVGPVGGNPNDIPTKEKCKEHIKKGFTGEEPADYELDRLDYYSFGIDRIYKGFSQSSGINKGVFFSGATIAEDVSHQLIKKIKE